MTPTDHDPAAAPGEPDDPDPDVTVLPDADDLRWALDLDTRLDPATAARLREQARRTRARIERRLIDAGHLPLAGVAAPGARHEGRIVILPAGRLPRIGGPTPLSRG